MARSKAQLTHAKRAREMARLEKRVRKQEKKEARKLAATEDPSLETDSVETQPDDPESETQPDDPEGLSSPSSETQPDEPTS
jgi:hypothetical protein